MGSRGALLGLLALLFGIGTAAACSDSEPPDVPTYGPPGSLGSQSPDPPPGATSSSSGGSSGGSSSGGGTEGDGGGGTNPNAQFACEKAGGSLVPDAGGCSVSWSQTIFPAMQGAWGCTSATCHGGATDPPSMAGATASAVYTLLANTPTSSANALNVINPCSTNPADSTFVCCTAATGTCGLLMPETPGTMTATGLTEIATWVACGAPQN